MQGLRILKKGEYLSYIETANSFQSLKAFDSGLEVILFEGKAETILIFQPSECIGSLSTYYILEGLIIYEGDETYLSAGDCFTMKDICEPLYFKPISDFKILWISTKNIFHKREYENKVLNEQLQNIQEKDQYTKEHCNRVSCLSLRTAKKLYLSEEQLENLLSAAAFHDVGKILIPIEILNKPERLTDTEYDIMKKHTSYGYDIIKSVFYESVANVVVQHHERVNGQGYPFGLMGDEISTEAKIIAVADSYDAMTTDRPYRKGMTPKEAYAELRRYSGIYYEREIVDTFAEILKEDGIIM